MTPQVQLVPLHILSIGTFHSRSVIDVTGEKEESLATRYLGLDSGIPMANEVGLATAIAPLLSLRKMQEIQHESKYLANLLKRVVVQHQGQQPYQRIRLNHPVG